MDPKTKQLTVSNACSCGNKELLEILLAQGSPANNCNNHGWQPLFYAISGNHYSCVEILLRHKDVSINWQAHDGDTPLHIACQGDSPLGMIQLLLKNGAEINAENNRTLTPLCEVILNSACQLSVELLLKHGANVKMNWHQDDSPLHIAIRRNLHKLAKILLMAGADPNASELREPPLWLSASSGSLDTMKLLVNEFHSNLNVTDIHGTTPLYVAVDKKHISCVDFLLDNNADANISDDRGVVPLHAAIQHNLLDVIKRLLKCTNIDMNKPWIQEDQKTISFLCLAIDNASSLLTVLQLLLTNCANPDLHVQHVGVDSLYGNFYNLVNPNNETYFRAKKFTKIFQFVYYFYKYDTPLGYLLERSEDPNIYDAARLLIEKGSSVNTINPCIRPPLVALFHNADLATKDFTTFKKIFMLLVDNNVDIEYQISSEKRSIFMNGPDALALACFLSKEVLMLFLSHSRFTVLEVLNMWRQLTFMMGSTDVEESNHFSTIAEKCMPIIIAACVEMAGSYFCDRKLRKLAYSTRFTPAYVDQCDLQPLCIPKSLQHMCRYKVREVLSINSPVDLPLWEVVDKLYIPTTIKNYLLYKDNI